MSCHPSVVQVAPAVQAEDRRQAYVDKLKLVQWLMWVCFSFLALKVALQRLNNVGWFCLCVDKILSRVVYGKCWSSHLLTGENTSKITLILTVDDNKLAWRGPETEGKKAPIERVLMLSLSFAT